MPAEARVTPIWKKQKLFISVFLFAVAAWFLWDGFVSYPKSNERWLAQDALERAGRLSEWPAVAVSHGWTTEKPHKYYTEGDLDFQLGSSVVTALLGVFSILFWFTQKDRLFRTDAEAVYTPKGVRVPFEAITGVGKKLWESKGYATVRYELAGKSGEFRLDDYKFDTEATHQILAEIEEKLLARASA